MELVSEEEQRTRRVEMQSTNRTKKKRKPKTMPVSLRTRLESKLLPLGGSRVIGQVDPHAAVIAQRGHLFPQRVRMRRGEPHHCHFNAAELWASSMDKYQLVTGYALDGDKWLSHSWVVDGKNLYETTHRFDRYFGVELGSFLAFKFWVENVIDLYYLDRELPSSFWESHPGIAKYLDELAQLPKEEWFRRMRAESQGLCA
jgi:hypothetical protein